MSELQTAKYLAPFERETALLSEGAPEWLAAFRRAGAERFAQTGLPTPRDEDWRYTSLEALHETGFDPVLQPSRQPLIEGALDGVNLGQLPGDRLVFVDGFFAPELSRVSEDQPGELGSLRTVLREKPESLRPRLGRLVTAEQSPFAALNQVYFTDGLWFHLPAGAVRQHPVHLLHVRTGRQADAALHARHVLLLGAGAKATIVEHYVGLRDTRGLTNAVTELVLEEGAEIEHIRFQEESRQVFHLGFTGLHLAAGCRVAAHNLSTGGRLFRHHYAPTLDGEGIECVLNGLYLAKADQLADHYMVVDHAKPRGESHEYFNGILADRARGVFHGRILVRPGAQKTDAKQTNKNLLLSEAARATAKPQLEIYADDVKCTHGATIGQLDPDAIFYLRARGIGLELARRMLVHSFAGEITSRIRRQEVREPLEQIVWDWLEALESVHIDPHDGRTEPVAVP